MKRILTLSLLLAAGACAFAQQEKIMLEAIDETNIGEYRMTYSYNNDEQLAYLVCDNMYDTYKKEFIYDENKNVNHIWLYAWDGFDWIVTADIEYNLDENGRLVNRKNWNWNSEVKPDFYDAEIKYEYDDNGNMTNKVTYLFVGSGYEVVDSTAYKYNSNRLMKREVYSVSGGEKTLNNYDVYTYNSKGQLTEEVNYMYDGGGVSAVPYCKHNYEYDRKGNMLSEAYFLTTTTGKFQVQDSTSYTFNTDIDASQVVYPVDPEEPADYEDALKSQMTGYTVYNLEEMTGELVLTQIYEYSYSPFVSAVKDKVADKAKVSAAVSGETLFVMGLQDKSAEAVITDLNGRVVMQGNINAGMLDIFRLDKGMYVLSVEGQNVKFRK